jgi:hypothetical protein
MVIIMIQDLTRCFKPCVLLVLVPWGLLSRGGILCSNRCVLLALDCCPHDLDCHDRKPHPTLFLCVILIHNSWFCVLPQLLLLSSPLEF